nr:murein biosynthesis integral membrane protein MurJ [Agarilytica rhodophyticola]
MATQTDASSSQPSKKSLLKSSAVVSFMTMLSRVLGLVRDIVFARFIGAEANADAFFVAFKIPNFFRRLFAEGAFAQAFVPVLSEYRTQGSYAAVRHFIDRICGCLGISLIVLTSFVVIASPAVAAIFGIGFLLNYPEKFWLTSELLRITFPYLMLISLTGLAGAILNSYDKFAVPAITPVFLNIVLIMAAAVVSPWFEQPVFALAWGVLIAGIIQLLFQVPFLMKLGLLPHPTVDWSDESVRKVLKLMAPAMFGVSVSQINLLFDTVLASFLPTGSVSWLYFSDRLVELPLGVFGVGIATVILPNLSRQHASGGSKFSDTIDWGIKLILLIAVPASIALIILAKPILFTLFQYEKTSVRAINMASLSLQAYALGLTAFMLIKVLASGFFSRQDMTSPVRIGIIAMLANMGFNLVFVLPLHFIWQIGHVGLALATAASAYLNAGLLFLKLKRDQIYIKPHGWSLFLLRLLLSSALMASMLLLVQQMLPSFESLTWWQRVTNLSIYVVCGVFTYFVVLFLSGLRLHHLKLHLD